MTRRIAVLGVLLACTLAYAIGRGDDGEALAVPHGDAMYYYVYLPSLCLDGDLDFADEYAVTGNPWQMPDAPTGRPGNVFGVGPALFASPLFLLGHGIAIITGARRDGFSSVEIWLAGFASVLATVGALFFALRLLSRRYPDRAVMAGVIAFAGGPLVFYACRQPHMAHPFAALFATWLIDAWDASYEQPRTLRVWLQLGTLLGAAVLARPQLAPWGVCLVVAGIADLRARRSVVPILAGAAAAFAVVLPQLVVWKINYGAWVTVPQGPDFMRWDAPAWSEVLFSSRNGVLPWTPVYAIALVGLVASVRRMPRLAGVLLAGLIAQVVINGAAWDWWGGGSFGARRFESAFVAFAVGAAAVLRYRRIGAVVLGYLALVNVVLALDTTPVSMRQKGGSSAADAMRDQLGVFAAPAAVVSSLANLPARALFALHHGTSLAAYDEIVGVHWLQETYPALTTRTLRTQAKRNVADIPRLFVDGFRADVMAGDTARVLIGLNLRSPVTVHVDADASITLAWNGSAVAGPVSPRRGTNTLSITGAPGTRVRSIELTTDLTQW